MLAYIFKKSASQHKIQCTLTMERPRVEAAVKALLLNLPKTLVGWWLDPHHLLHTILQHGGISSTLPAAYFCKVFCTSLLK